MLNCEEKEFKNKNNPFVNSIDNEQYSSFNRTNPFVHKTKIKSHTITNKSLSIARNLQLAEEKQQRRRDHEAVTMYFEAISRNELLTNKEKTALRKKHMRPYYESGCAVCRVQGREFSRPSDACFEMHVNDSFPRTRESMEEQFRIDSILKNNDPKFFDMVRPPDCNCEDPLSKKHFGISARVREVERAHYRKSPVEKNDFNRPVTTEGPGDSDDDEDMQSCDGNEESIYSPALKAMASDMDPEGVETLFHVLNQQARQRDTGSVWESLSEMFRTLKEKGADVPMILATKVSELWTMFKEMLSNITTTITKGVASIKFFASADWDFIMKCLGLLAIYLIGASLGMLNVASLIAALYANWAFDNVVYRFVPGLVSAAILFRPGTHITQNVSVTTQAGEEMENGLMFGGISLLSAAAMGKFTFFQDTKKYDDFLVRLDRQNRAFGAIECLATRIGNLVNTALGWIGLEEYGFAPDLSQSVPQDVELYVNEVKYFSNAKVLDRMNREMCECERAHALFESLPELLHKYRGVKPIIDVIQRHAGYVHRVFNLANLANPRLSKPRDETVCVFLRGGAGVGKTRLVYLLTVEALVTMGIIKDHMTHVEIEDEISKNMYSRAAAQVYWDGYRGQAVTVVDDFGQIKDNVSNPNIEYDELIRISNSFPYNLHMARLDEKASSFFRSPVYIATTNLPNINPPSLVCAEAVHRRINLAFEVSIKPDFADGNGRVLPEIGRSGLRTDIYDFSVWDPASGGVDGVKLSFKDVTKLLSSEIRKNRAQGKTVMARSVEFAMKRMENVESEGADDFALVTDATFASAPWTDHDQRLKETVADLSTTDAVMYLHRRSPLNHNVSCYLPSGRRAAVVAPFDSREHIRDMQETVGWMDRMWTKFQSLWAMVNIKTVLGGLSLLGLAYGGFVYGREYVKYRRTNNVQGEPEDEFLEDQKCYRANQGDYDAGRFRYNHWLPQWYGGEETKAICAPTDDQAHLDSDGNQIAMKSDYMRSRGLDEDLIKREEEIWQQYKAMRSAVAQSGKEKRVVKNRGPQARGRPVPIPVKTEAWNNCNAEDIGNMLAANMRTIAVPGHRAQNMFMLKERMFAVNAHLWKIMLKHAEIDQKDFFILRHVGAEQGTQIKFKDVDINQCQWHGYDMDLMIGTLPSRSTMCAADLTKFIVKESELNDLIGKSTVLTVPSGPHLMLITGTVCEILNQEMYDATLDLKFVTRAIKIREKTSKGDCGGIYMTDSKDTRRLFGLHSGGDKMSFGFAVPLFQELLCVQAQSAEDHELLQSQGGNVNILGTRTPAFANVKSKIVQSGIFGKIIESQMAPAALEKPLVKDGPMLKAIEKQFGPVYAVDEQVLNVARCDYERKLANSGPSDLRVLSFSEATRGIEGSDYIRPINRSRSAGYPWCLDTKLKGKTKWFGYDQWEYNEHTRVLQDKIERDIAEMEEGHICEYVFLDTLKDETRSLEKVLAKKTRAFAAAPMDFIIVFRMYFLPFIAFMMRNRIFNESAVGIRAQSEEWTELYRVLTSKGKRVIAGDFSNYDGSLNPQILWAVFDVIERYYEYSGATAKEQMVRKCLWENLVNSVHLCGNILYQLNHSQPSGNPSTAVLNTMYNSIACRYVFYQTYGQNVDFADYVAMIAYGDDNVLNVSPLAPDFNQERMAFEFARFGMTYTDEAKSGVLQDKTIEQVKFLKRGFAFDRSLDFCFAPLEIDSILDCFNWTKKSDSEPDIMKQNAESAFIELAMHEEMTFKHYSKRIVSAMRYYEMNLVPHKYSDYRTFAATGTLLKRYPNLCWC